MEKNILYITNLPAPYKISYFNELSKYTELTVIFERSSAKNRDPSWEDIGSLHFEAVFLNGVNFGTDMCIDFSIIEVIKRHSNSLVLLNGYSSPTEILAIRYLRTHNIQFGLICDGLLENKESFVIERLKTYLISSASFWMSSGLESDKVLEKHGAEPDKIYRYPFSSVNESDLADVPYCRKSYKDMVNCRSKYMILYVGQMIHRKGIDLLLDAIKKIDLDFQLYMIGGQLSSSDKRVTNIGFLRKRELKKYYMAADLFVIPTREDIWGLVVNEALGYGVPVLATERCGAALEIIKDGKNGAIVPVDSVSALQTEITHILQVPSPDSYMMEAVSSAQDYTIEKMAKRTWEIVCNQLGR